MLSHDVELRKILGDYFEKNPASEGIANNKYMTLIFVPTTTIVYLLCF